MGVQEESLPAKARQHQRLQSGPQARHASDIIREGSLSKY